MTKQERVAWENKLRDLVWQRKKLEKQMRVLDKVIKEISEDLRKGA